MIWTVPLGLLALAHAGDADTALRFGRDVRPILADHCFECHGPDAAQRRGDLRLDLPGSLATTRSSGLALLAPGDPARSELARRITAADRDERMPPAEFRHTLDEAERAILLRWIEEGGTWEQHWAYAPVADTEPGFEPGTEPGRGLIDAHLAAAWSVAGVEPSAEADARTAVRRLALDLTGLPPAPAQVEHFLDDDSDAGWGALVDELLASPHHAERLAVFWLDLVRYADTVGYHGDQRWSVWPYRDWVIRAFADNVPFDEFTVAQVAGDLLADGTLDDRVAATYGRLNMVTFEGGSQPKEYLLKYQADRVRNLSMAWLGSTMGCAECHDHKFDPTTTRDFYSLAAFFADIQEEGVYTRFQEGAVPPELVVPSAMDSERLARYESELAGVEADLATAAEGLGDERAAWERAARRERFNGFADLAWVDDDPPAGAVVEGAWTWVEGDVALSGRRARVQSAPELVQHFFHGAPEPLALQAGDRFFLYVHLDPADPPRTVMLQVHAPDWDHRAYWGEDRIPFGGVGADGPEHRRLGDLPAAGGWARLEIDPAAIGLGPGSVVDGFAFTQFGGTVRWDRAGVRTRSATLVRAGAPPAVATAVSSAWRRPADASLVRAFFAERAPSLAPLRSERERLSAERATIEAGLPRTLAVVSVGPRETRVRPRGNWMDDSGEVVDPAVPHFLPGLPALDRRATRLDLARWLVAPENPLTARVFVNRVWRLFFGEGLARSVDDFGLQGEAPDHPELLDRLARDFVASGWDVRALVRRIVTSRAYRASSDPSPDLLADPENRLFARQTRRRLEAEFVRDVALAASGLLEPAVGGPSVKPYQPAGYWAQLNFPRRTWSHDVGPSLYRRGLYTFWCRTYLHPTLKAFDAPAREECTARRSRSNTPLQALALLGDPAFVEAARVLAERVVGADHPHDRARLDDVFQRVLARPSTPPEASILLELLASQAAHYRSDPDAARALAAVGEAPAAELDAITVASWAAVTRAVLNRGETITRR